MWRKWGSFFIHAVLCLSAGEVYVNDNGAPKNLFEQSDLNWIEWHELLKKLLLLSTKRPLLRCLSELLLSTDRSTDRSRGRCWAAIRLIIVQNRQAVQSMKMRSMDWTLEDNMVDGCSSASHSQAAEEATPHFYKQERKRPTPVRRRLIRTQALLGRVVPGGCGFRCRGWRYGVS